MPARKSAITMLAWAIMWQLCGCSLTEGHRSRAFMRLRLTDIDGAWLDIERAVQLDPEFLGVNGRGLVHLRRGKLDEALADFNLAIKLRDDFSAAYLNRGRIYARRADIAKAFIDFDTALKHDDKNPSALVNRGRAHQHCGRKDQALADFRLALTFPDRCYDSQKVRDDVCARIVTLEKG
jgi:tetratricopeptide (TPR) repeat protein